MILVYSPEGAPERRWTFQPEKLMSSEAEAIEKVTHLTYAEFGMELIKGSATCRRALLWVLLKREDAPLRIGQVDPPVGSIGLEFETHELTAMRDGVKGDPSLSDDDREMALGALDEEIAKSSEETVDVPKAPASAPA